MSRVKHIERVEHRIDFLARKLASWKVGSVKDEEIRVVMREEKKSLEWLLRRERELHELQVAAAAAIEHKQ